MTKVSCLGGASDIYRLTTGSGVFLAPDHSNRIRPFLSLITRLTDNG
jgi:hypothetical protein